MAEEKKGDTLSPDQIISKIRNWFNSQHWFANVMMQKMLKNTHKVGWYEMTLPYLRWRVDKELEELDAAMTNTVTVSAAGGWVTDASLDAIIDECADASNFLMMLADNARRIKEARHGR